jgi:hypothetical protein
MRCPKCSNDHKRKLGGRCSKCGYNFALDKDRDEGLTDGRFLLAVKRASQAGTKFFTENQLHTALCRTLYPWKAGRDAVLSGLVALAIAGVLLWSDRAAEALFVAFVGPVFCLAQWFKKSAYRPLTRRSVPALIKKMNDAGHSLRRLLQEPTLHQPPPKWSEPDIYKYGVERLLIVQRPLLVDLMVKNGLHAELRALVVSEDGYPSYIHQHAVELAHRREDLPVFLLHDATPYGIRMRIRLQDSADWSFAANRLIDVGAFPADFSALGLPAVRGGPDGYKLPIDTLSNHRLASLVSAALLGGSTLAQAIDERKTQEDREGYG